MTEKDEQEIRKIRAQYEEHELSQIEELKQLNAKVVYPSRIFGYVFGIIFTLVFGTGLTMVLGKLFESYQYSFVIGVILCGIGLACCVINPFISKKIYLSQRKKYQSRILELSSQLLEQNAQAGNLQ